MIFQPQIIGKPLPALTNPGTAADLLSGKQLIDGSGKVLTGTLVNREIHTVVMQGSGTTSLEVENVEQQPIIVIAFSGGTALGGTINSSIQIRTIARFSRIIYRLRSGSSDSVVDSGGFNYSSADKKLSISGFLDYVYDEEKQYTVVYI